MSAAEIVGGLRLLNRWRRGDESIVMPSPAYIGELIDSAAELISRTHPAPENLGRSEQSGAESGDASGGSGAGSISEDLPGSSARR